MKTFKISNSALRGGNSLSGREAGAMLVWWKAYANFVANECNEEQQDKITDYFHKAMAEANVILPDEALLAIVQQANTSFAVLNGWLNDNFEGSFLNPLS